MCSVGKVTKTVVVTVVIWLRVVVTALQMFSSILIRSDQVRMTGYKLCQL